MLCPVTTVTDAMNERPDDATKARAPRLTRRLSDKISIAYHHACDQGDFEVAERLLQVLEMVVDRYRGTERRRDREALVAGYKRLWQLRHPEPV